MGAYLLFQFYKTSWKADYEDSLSRKAIWVKHGELSRERHLRTPCSPYTTYPTPTPISHYSLSCLDHTNWALIYSLQSSLLFDGNKSNQQITLKTQESYLFDTVIPSCLFQNCEQLWVEVIYHYIIEPGTEDSSGKGRQEYDLLVYAYCESLCVFILE